ncbi:cold shock domain protein 1 [Prunus dulcis]|uniref:Cold shock domain protein 1 n=1 Tax=Prunus dulcis TaxID=3755 RepID=A0A4Y1QL31_PRUDU|nr:cold shock domain protein 1 [Prunus dulcis]
MGYALLSPLLWLIFEAGGLCWRLCQNFGRKSRFLVSGPGIGEMSDQGGRVPRWGANPPPPSPPHSPPSSPPVEEHAEGNEPNFRHLLSQFTRTISTALQGRQSTEGSDIKRVKELGAKEFFGTSDPAEADAWLTDIKRIFEVIQCPDGDRTVRRGYANPAALTWEEFQRVFFDQFYPHSYKNAKKSEFLHLKQGSMSVLEYEHKFIELSRFAPELVTTEEDKCTRFEEGLWLDIQAVVTATTYPTMRALAQAADRVARKYSLGAGIGRRRRDSSGFGGHSQGLSKRGESSSSSAGSGRSGGRGSSSGSGRSGSRPTWSQHSGQQSVASTTRDSSQQFNTRHYRSEGTLLTVGGSARQETGAQQGQGSRGQSQTHSSASSLAAGSSSSSGVQSTFRGRSGRGQRGQSRCSTTQARVFSMTQQEAQATPDVITASSRLSSAAEPDRVLTSLEPSLNFWGNVQFTRETLPKFCRKSRFLVSGPGIGKMSVTRRDSLRFSRIPGRILSSRLFRLAVFMPKFLWPYETINGDTPYM